MMLPKTALGKTALGTGLFVGGVSAYNTFNNSPDDEDRIQQTLGFGFAGMAAGAMGVYGASKVPSILRKTGSALGTLSKEFNSVTPLPHGTAGPLPRQGAFGSFARTPRGAEGPMNKSAAYARGEKLRNAKLAKNTNLSIGPANTIPEVVETSAFKYRAAKAEAFWKRIPGKGVLLPILAAAGVMGVMASSESNEPEFQAEGSPNGIGGYNYAPTGTSGVGARSRAMNATGDVALGAHRGRH